LTANSQCRLPLAALSLKGLPLVSIATMQVRLGGYSRGPGSDYQGTVPSALK
jgi:hypothetical protein